MLKPTSIRELIKNLDRAFPSPEPPLRHRSVFELLISVILSAQCTDERVNIVTQTLFPKNRACTPEDILKMGESRVREIIRSTGYFNSKTKALMGCSQAIHELGHVPSSLEELTKLPGVGNKTAQVVQAQWFKIPSFPVDTHIHRVANRIGLANSGTNRDKTEKSLKAAIPKEHWIKLHLQLVFHGRKTCTARKPKCWECPIQKQCQWPLKRLMPDASSDVSSRGRAKPQERSARLASRKSPRK